MAVAAQPIEIGRSEDLVTEDRPPLRDQLLGSDEQNAPIVAPLHELEEEMCASLLEGQLAEFVDSSCGAP